MTLALTDIEKQIMEGKVCPYCKNKTKLVDATEVYGHRGRKWGKLYWCQPCDAYVGCHRNTERSKGRCANKELRHWKKEAHKFFDMIWKLEMMTRAEAYQLLSLKLNLPPEYTHIGMFGVKTCKDVVYYSKQFMNDMRRLDLDFGATPKTKFYEI